MPDTNIYEMAQTWNNAGTTFAAISMDVDDQASAADSKFQEFLLNGVRKFSITKNGSIEFSDQSGLVPLAPNNIGFKTTSVVRSGASNLGLFVGAGSAIGFSNQTDITGVIAFDLELRRDAANTLAQRNGTNPQAFNIYNSYTDAANYERGGLAWSGNELQLFSGFSGTGVARDIKLRPSRSIVVDNGVQTNVPALKIEFGAGQGGVQYLRGSSGHTYGTSSNNFEIRTTNWSGENHVVSGAVGLNSARGAFRYEMTNDNTYSAAGSLMDLRMSSTVLQPALAVKQDSYDNAPVFTIGSDGSMTATGPKINLSSLPTVDPAVAGDLWNDAGTVKVSAG